jgi:Na+/phosphate symporter
MVALLAQEREACVMKDKSIFVNPFRILSPKLNAEALRIEELHTRPVSTTLTLEEGLIIMLSKLIEITRLLTKAFVSGSPLQMNQCAALARDVHEQEKILTLNMVAGTIRKDLLKVLIRFPYRLERIGDMLESMLTCCRAKAARSIPFSDRAHGELEQLFAILLDMLKNLRDAMKTPNKVLLEAILAEAKKMTQLIEESKMAHWQRLEEGFCSAEASSMHRDLLDSIRTAKEYIEQLSRSLIEVGENPDLEHDMIRATEHGMG